MPDYETLDAIADAYTPLLAGVSLLLMAARAFTGRWREAGPGVAGFVAVAGVAFGMMVLDRRLNIWPALGLDYSTHTATALGLVMLLVRQARNLAALWLGSLVGYLLLMLYQRYHTLADVVTSAVVVALPLALILASLYRSGEAPGQGREVD